jgi:excisionase family DNA binding protein
MPAQLLTVAEAAHVLRVKPSRLYALLRARTIPAVRIGRQVRVSSETLDAFIAGGGVALDAEADHAPD